MGPTGAAAEVLVALALRIIKVVMAVWSPFGPILSLALAMGPAAAAADSQTPTKMAVCH